MEDFVLSLLAALAEIIAEVVLEPLLEIAAAETLALLSRVARRFFSAALRANQFVIIAVLAVCGAGSGYLSVLLFPHPLMQRPRFHGISLVISPLLTGLAMSEVGRWFLRRGRQPAAVESFRYGFVFAFAMAFVRLWLAK
jgi:hypothetical protein